MRDCCFQALVVRQWQVPQACHGSPSPQLASLGMQCAVGSGAPAAALQLGAHMALRGRLCCSLPALRELDLYPGNGELCSNQSVPALFPSDQDLLSGADDSDALSLPGCEPSLLAAAPRAHWWTTGCQSCCLLFLRHQNSQASWSRLA